MIIVNDISLKINNKAIFDGVSLEIPDDTKTAIIGKSGCGKTMLVKTILGLYKPQSGSVCIDGISLHGYRSMNIVSMLFQNSALLDSFTVFQNVGLPLVEARFHSNQVYEKVMCILKTVGLEQCAEMYPSEMSGGMKKRIGLARAMITSPKYLILDEPTTGLDPITSREVINFLKKVIADENVIPITITHDPNCINELSDNLIIMENGAIIYSGNRNNLEKENNLQVKKFFESFFHGITPN